MDVPYMIFWRWFVGLVFSLLVGHFVTKHGLRCLRQYITGKPTLGGQKQTGIPAWMVGFIERFFFTIAVTYNVSGTAVAMMIWCTVKMATNWAPEEKEKWKPFHGTALLGSFVSMLFALAGGLIIRAPSLG